MGSGFEVEAKQLQRELCALGGVPAVKGRGVDGQRANGFIFFQLPGGRNLRQLAGVYFNLARWRFQRIGFRVLAELFIGHKVSVRIFALINSHFFQFVIGRKLRIFCEHFGIQELQPLFLRASFGEFLMDVRPEAFRHLAHDPVDGLALKLRRGHGLEENQVAHVPGVIVRNDVFLLDGHQVRQHDIGILR